MYRGAFCFQKESFVGCVCCFLYEVVDEVSSYYSDVIFVVYVLFQALCASLFRISLCRQTIPHVVAVGIDVYQPFCGTCEEAVFPHVCCPM